GAGPAGLTRRRIGAGTLRRAVRRTGFRRQPGGTDRDGRAGGLPAIARHPDAGALRGSGGGQRMSHDLLVYIAKAFGPIWMGGFLLVVLIRTYAPSRRAAHDRAARSILLPDDGGQR